MTDSTIRDSKFGRSKTFKIIRRIIFAFIWLGIWQMIYLTVNKEILIVSPFHVVKRLWELCSESGFWLTVAGSIFKIMLGFFAALAAGSLLAWLTSASEAVYEFIYPVISIVKATPVASFIILALVWLKSFRIPSFIAFLIVLPVVWSNISQGIKNTDSKLLDMSKVFGFNFMKKVKLIYLPSVKPSIISAFTTGIGMAWKAGIAAEVLAKPINSIGGEIYNAKVYLETADLFAWTAVVIILSVIIEKLLMRLISWRRR